MADQRMDIEQAITYLLELEPGCDRGATAMPGHQFYEGVRSAGPLTKCTCGQKNLGWRFPEFIATKGEKVWSVHRDATTNKVVCGSQGYHSKRYSGKPACC